MMHYSYSLLLILISSISFSQSNIFNNKSDEIFIGINAEFYEDFSQAKDIFYISDSADFSPHNKKVFKIWNNTANYWIRFSVKNSTDSEIFLIKDLAQTTSATLYKQTDINKFDIESIGNNISFYDRKFKYTPYIFSLNLNKDSTATYYLKIQGDELMNIPIFITRKDRMYSYVIFKNNFFFLFIGFMLVAFLFNLFIFISIKDINYLYYIFYIFSITLTLLSVQDYTIQFFWPDNKFMADNDTIIFACFSYISIFLLSSSFLRLKTIFPVFYRFCIYFSPISFIPLVFSFFDLRHISYLIINCYNLLTCLIILLIGTRLVILRYKPARFFMIGWSFMICCSLIFAISNFGLFENSFFSYNAIFIGVSIESLLFSIALADKINYYKEIIINNSDKTKSILKSKNDELETKVVERTKEINHHYQLIKQQNKEKEILLKEVHHRVKNNLQIITSLLSLQDLSINDSKLKEIFTVSQQRIKSMALIHEMLYQSNDMSEIAYDVYLKELSNNLINSYESKSDKIELKFNAEKINLHLDIAIPLGLIVNEIITNSIKYAFKDITQKCIFIKFSTSSQESVLEIGDNGIGIPENQEINHEKLGFKLIESLGKQINAVINLSSGKNGTIYRITLKKNIL